MLSLKNNGQYHIFPNTEMSSLIRRIPSRRATLLKVLYVLFLIGVTSAIFHLYLRYFHWTEPGESVLELVEGAPQLPLSPALLYQC